jgi:hypothetical protein
MIDYDYDYDYTNKNDIMEQKMVAEFQVGSGTVLLCLAFHPNNKPWIGVGRSDGFVHIFDHEVLTRVHRFQHSSNNNFSLLPDPIRKFPSFHYYYLGAAKNCGSVDVGLLQEWQLFCLFALQESTN